MIYMVEMCNFDDAKQFILIHHFNIPAIYTFGDKDRDKRENIRRNALKNFQKKPYRCKWYGFRIKVERSMFKRPLDIENIPKLIIDAFSSEQIDRDKSRYPRMKLYPDDTLEHIRVIQIEGKFSDNKDNTEVWIFGKK